MNTEKNTPEDAPLSHALVDWVATSLDSQHPADTADELENLSLTEQLEYIQEMDVEDAAESITEMERHDRIALVSTLSPSFAAAILEVMSPDDAADILEDLPQEARAGIFKKLEREDAEEISDLLRFDPDSAGGVMNTEILALDQHMNAQQAITLVRDRVEESEIPYYAYIVDEYRHLKGVLSLRDLLLSPGRTILKDLLHEQNLIYVSFDVDKEEVARLISRYNFFALPVVDHEQRLLGMVTVDDVIDIIQEEASEDMQSMVGAGADETVDSPWTYSLGKRLPWLVLNVLNSAMSAFVVHMFEGTIAQMAILAALMPIVANQAGNTGQQSLAVMIRQLAMERFNRKKSWVAVAREAKIGLANGLIVGILVFAGLFGWTRNLALAAVMSVALGVDMLIGAVAGASIPLILKEIGRDPAQASSIFLTTLTDSLGFFTFLGLAAIFLF
ncbi:MAG: magnesium transporter [Deltaproteobacteria bacterium]|nr:magnesium transporter [Deltaproteobacteria bacterium]